MSSRSEKLSIMLASINGKLVVVVMDHGGGSVCLLDLNEIQYNAHHRQV